MQPSVFSFQVHTTTVAIAGVGVLIRGPSGNGKSDLALRLIDAGASLVADDRTVLRSTDGRLWASAPPALRGLLEVRGVGILRVPWAAETPLGLVVDLVAQADELRLPDPGRTTDLPQAITRLHLWPFAASAALKVRRAVERLMPAADAASDFAAVPNGVHAG